MTSSEVENLKAQISELSQRLAAVELARDTGGDTDSSGAVDHGGANEAQVIPQQKLHAFDITCDGREADPWLVYLPDGCVRFCDFTPDRIDPEPDANTHLADLGTDIKDGGIYAHLYLELSDEESGNDSTSENDSATEPEVTGFPLFSIDTEPEQQPSEERMKVVNIQIATIKDGAVSQTVIGALILKAKSGTSAQFVGDNEASQFIRKTTLPIEFKGFAGEVEGKKIGNSGLTFLSIGEGKDQSGKRTPAKMIIDVKGRSDASGCGNTENWGCHSLRQNGSILGHFLGCKDIDILTVSGGGGGGGGGGGDDPDDPDIPDDVKVRTIIGEEGEAYGSEPKQIYGNVRFEGADKSGLKTTTYRDAEGRSYMLVDLERGEGDEDAEFGIHKLTLKGKTDADDKEVRIFAEDDIEIPARKDVVESLNGETGDLTIEGGHKVQVTKDGKTIIVSLDESKEDPPRDPNTNCGDHPGSVEGGGVIIGPAVGGGGGGAGVPAEGGAASSGVGCDC